MNNVDSLGKPQGPGTMLGSRNTGEQGGQDALIKFVENDSRD